MSERKLSTNSNSILGRLGPHEFVGRADELARIVTHATTAKGGRGMLLLIEPAAGVSELLRQAYDQIFLRRENVVPIYFAFSKSNQTVVSAAIEFLNTFLQQYIAFSRDEPELSRTPLTLQDLVNLAPASDLAWLEQLVDAYTKVRFSNDDKAVISFCLAAPQRVPVRFGRPFVMLDGAELAGRLSGEVTLVSELLQVFDRANFSFVLAGLRRQMLKAAHDAGSDFHKLDVLRVERLTDDQSRKLVERVAQRTNVIVSDEARDLLVQQFEGSPLFITHFFQAAREKGLSLQAYLDCERLYVDEILGGHIHRYFDELLEEITPAVETRQALIRMLWQAYVDDDQTSSFDSWRKRLHLNSTELEKILYGLHLQELVNWDGVIIEAAGGSQPWKDYLKVRYRLDVLNEPRALVFAEALTDALKRAPAIMARHYRKLSRLDLRDVLARFDCQRVPKVLFNYDEFRGKYLGAPEEEVQSGIDSETEQFRLPQVVHVATCTSFYPDMRQLCEPEKCVLAHSFEDAGYADSQEVVWLAAEIDSKLEVEIDEARVWADRLASLGDGLGLGRLQIWLIARQGFSQEACIQLEKSGTLTSNRAQAEHIASRLSSTKSRLYSAPSEADEFLVVVPMGKGNELIAASTVEQIARRLAFRPEAINQIKTAIVEACINASEHSLSPDRKIYQRFRLENDRLVVTISSRGVVPAGISKRGIDRGGDTEGEIKSEERRGWGLKLIRTLMDEVEFERVDEGTSLKMTKLLRP